MVTQTYVRSSNSFSCKFTMLQNLRLYMLINRLKTEEEWRAKMGWLIAMLWYKVHNMGVPFFSELLRQARPIKDGVVEVLARGQTVIKYHNDLQTAFCDVFVKLAQASLNIFVFIYDTGSNKSHRCGFKEVTECNFARDYKWSGKES